LLSGSYSGSCSILSYSDSSYSQILIFLDASIPRTSSFYSSFLLFFLLIEIDSDWKRPCGKY